MHIQILIDNKYRDFLSAFLIKRYVEEHSSYRVVLSNKVNYARIFRAYSPRILIVPQSGSFLKKLIPEFAKTCDVYLLPSEGGFLSPETVKNIFERGADRQVNHQYLKRVYMWGRRVEEICAAHNIFTKEQMLVSGNPRFDLFRILRKQHAQEEKRCGFATTLRVITSIIDLPLLEFIEQYSALGTHNPIYWNEGGQFADTIWYETATIEAMLFLMKELRARGVEDKFYVRPHPFERDRDYRAFMKKNDVIINKEEPLMRMLEKVYVYLVSCSTSTIDALMAGVPVISLNGLFEKKRGEMLIARKLWEEEFNHLTWMPESIEEAAGLIQKARAGELAIAPDLARVQKFLADCYHYDENTSATHIIGEDLITAMSGKELGRQTRAIRFAEHFLKESLCYFFRYKKGDYNYAAWRREDIRLREEFEKEATTYLMRKVMIKEDEVLCSKPC